MKQWLGDLKNCQKRPQRKKVSKTASNTPGKTPGKKKPGKTPCKLLLESDYHWMNLTEKEDFEEQIASFFESRPFYYDIGHKDYKNKTRKDAEVAEFAKELGIKGK